MTKEQIIMQHIDTTGFYIVDECDFSYDDAINSLLEKDEVRWSNEHEDMLIAF